LKNIGNLKLVASFAFVACFVFAQNASAGSGNVGGFAWSGTNSDVVNDGKAIGWVSFNNSAIDDGAGGVIPGGGGSYDYSVNIDEMTGIMSGYAWSAATTTATGKEGLGWISFNAVDASGCGAAAKVNTAADGNGRYNLSGYARVLSLKDQPSGVAGGWDGCIGLGGNMPAHNPDGVYIDSNGDFHGYAWSDMVLGYLHFEGARTTAEFAPDAEIRCDGTNCSGGTCDNTPGASWEFYPYAGSCPMCNTFQFFNDSAGSVKCSYWSLSQGGVEKYGQGFLGKQNINSSVFGDIAPGTYTLELRVSDQPYSAGNAACGTAVSDSDSRTVEVKQEVHADFQCTFDDPNSITTPPVWQDCTTADGRVDFANKMVKGGLVTVYIKDTSFASQGAAINDKEWVFTIDGVQTTAATDVASFKIGKVNRIQFTVSDDAGRHNCIDVTMGARPLPKWREISPVGMFLNSIFAGLSKIFTAVIYAAY
jgi:hypothetical protein